MSTAGVAAGRPGALDVALVSTLHDPAGRLLDALQERGAALAAYAGLYLTVTDTTERQVVDCLREAGATVIGGKNDQIGVSRRLALRTAFEGGHTCFLYCDFDRWLHWTGRFPEELDALPSRLMSRRPRPWYVCLGRTARAFATHPYVQRVTEAATNRTLSLALRRRLDATAGACWLSREGATIVLCSSEEPTNATDLEWPVLVYRSAPRRLAGIATEGLEFETAEFFAPEVQAAGGDAAWQRAHYDRPEVWSARLRLAADSVQVACQVLAAPRYASATDVASQEAHRPRVD